MIISDSIEGNGHPPEHFRALAEWCGLWGWEGEMWMRHFLPGRVVGLEHLGLKHVGFRFKNGDIHHRSLASVSGPVADKGFRWHKSNTWGGGKRLWAPCPPPLLTLRYVLSVEGETSAVSAAFGLSHRLDWWVVATTGAGMFPEPTSEPGATLRRIMRAASATAVAWPDDDTAGSKWLEGAAETLEGFPLGQVTGAEVDPRSVWRTMLKEKGLDAAAGRFAEICDKAAAGAKVAIKPAVPVPAVMNGDSSDEVGLPSSVPPAWKPTANGKRVSQPRGAIRRWLARKHPTQDSLMLAGAQPRGRGKMSCWNKEAHRAGDRNPSLSVTGRGEEEHFRCFGCGERGDIFVAYALGHHNGDSKAAARHVYEQIRRENGG